MSERLKWVREGSAYTTVVYDGIPVSIVNQQSGVTVKWLDERGKIVTLRPNFGSVKLAKAWVAAHVDAIGATQ